MTGQNQSEVLPNGNSLNGSSRPGRNDLHFAADSVSEAMTSLVRELQSGKPLLSFMSFCSSVFISNHFFKHKLTDISS